MKRFLSSLVLIFLFTSSSWSQSAQTFSERPIFVNGQDGYACYRIPAIIRAPNGDLLAFAEGRVNACSDFGDLDIVMRRSKDNGQTWSKLEVVQENGNLQVGNPAPLVDLLDPAFPKGRIFLLYNSGTNHENEVRKGNGIREVWYRSSRNNGKSWSEPVNITLSVHRPKQPHINPKYNFQEDWRSYALTPGHALQIQSGPFKGRLYIAANHSAGAPLPGFNEYRSHALFSDDHGKSWQLSANVDIPSANEATAAELPNGGVIMNIRQQNGEKRQRLIARSKDGGQSWEEVYFDSTLIGPVCEGSILNYRTPEGDPALLFSNPASTNSRTRLTVRMSLDEGRTWPIKRLVREGASAYSDLVIQENGQIGVLYEHGNGGSIHYAHFNHAWLIGGQ